MPDLIPPDPSSLSVQQHMVVYRGGEGFYGDGSGMYPILLVGGGSTTGERWPLDLAWYRDEFLASKRFGAKVSNPDNWLGGGAVRFDMGPEGGEVYGVGIGWETLPLWGTVMIGNLTYMGGGNPGVGYWPGGFYRGYGFDPAHPFSITEPIHTYRVPRVIGDDNYNEWLIHRGAGKTSWYYDITKDQIMQGGWKCFGLRNCCATFGIWT